jgi:hypothetical protein
MDAQHVISYSFITYILYEYDVKCATRTTQGGADRLRLPLTSNTSQEALGNTMEN